MPATPRTLSRRCRPRLVAMMAHPLFSAGDLMRRTMLRAAVLALLGGLSGMLGGTCLPAHAQGSTQANAASARPPSRGEYLARAGDCVACHSVRGGKAFAGGLRMGTPMGVIYSTNITPDPQTGIGSYSLRDFDRAVRSGIAKDGHRLYPAMPYPSYAKITDEDLRALYDFFMKE